MKTGLLDYIISIHYIHPSFSQQAAVQSIWVCVCSLYTYIYHFLSIGLGLMAAQLYSYITNAQVSSLLPPTTLIFHCTWVPPLLTQYYTPIHILRSLVLVHVYIYEEYPTTFGWRSLLVASFSTHQPASLTPFKGPWGSRDAYNIRLRVLLYSIYTYSFGVQKNNIASVTLLSSYIYLLVYILLHACVFVTNSWNWSCAYVYIHIYTKLLSLLI